MRPVKTAQHLKAVLETVVLTDTLRLLTLPCYTATQKTEAKWDTSLNANVSVEKLSIYGKYSLRDLTTLIAQLKKVTICCLDASNVEHVDYDRVSNPATLSKLPPPSYTLTIYLIMHFGIFR